VVDFTPWPLYPVERANHLKYEEDGGYKQHELASFASNSFSLSFQESCDTFNVFFPLTECNKERRSVVRFFGDARSGPSSTVTYPGRQDRSAYMRQPKKKD